MNALRKVLTCIFAIIVAFLLAACGDARASAPETPSYYVFESMTDGGTTITDPNELFLDRPTTIENWYYLSIALIDGEHGTLCTDGRIANFTYTYSNGTIELSVPQDFGYDGAKLTVGEGTLTLGGFGDSTTVLRQVDDPPKPFA